MLSEYVGEEKFLKGVSIYLKKHLFANSISRNLWEGIGEATGTTFLLVAASLHILKFIRTGHPWHYG